MQQTGMLPWDALFRVIERAAAGLGTRRNRDVTPKRGSEAEPTAGTDTMVTDTMGIRSEWLAWGRG